MPENRIHSQFWPPATADPDTPAVSQELHPARHELQALLRCPACQSILIPKLCMGRNGRYHHYLYVCAGHDQGCRTTREARHITVAAVECAIQTRLLKLREQVPSRERFVEEAIACIHWEVLRRVKAVDVTRKRQARVQARIENGLGLSVEPDVSSADRDAVEIEHWLDEHAELKATAEKYLREIQDLDALSEACRGLMQAWSKEAEGTLIQGSMQCRRACPI